MRQNVAGGPAFGFQGDPNDSSLRSSNCTGAVLRPVGVGMRLSGGRRYGVPDARGLLLTDQMRANLDAALTQMETPPGVRVVDLAVPGQRSAPRLPTPTILYEGRDLFGMPTPVPPFPDRRDGTTRTEFRPLRRL